MGSQRVGPSGFMFVPLAVLAKINVGSASCPKITIPLGRQGPAWIGIGIAAHSALTLDIYRVPLSLEDPLAAGSQAAHLAAAMATGMLATNSIAPSADSHSWGLLSVD